MTHKIQVILSELAAIDLELDENLSPKTCQEFLKNLPFKVEINIWGEEIYTEPSPINVGLENPKSLVELNDIAYWPTGKAICLFYGQTPIGNKNEIKPYSPVNILGKIINPNKSILSKINDGMIATFQISSK